MSFKEVILAGDKLIGQLVVLQGAVACTSMCQHSGHSRKGQALAVMASLTRRLNGRTHATQMPCRTFFNLPEPRKPKIGILQDTRCTKILPNRGIGL